MRDILDALENVQTNKKKPMDVKKEMNKQPAVMKALSLESETNEAISEKGRANLRKMIGDFERMAEEMNLSDESLDSIAMHLDQIMSDVQEIEGVRENKTPGDSHYHKEKAKELAKKDGKDPERLSYGELMDYIKKAQQMDSSHNQESVEEDKFDGYKIHRLGELQRKVDDVAKDIRLLGKTDSMPGATGAGDLTDQLTTMNKAIMMLQDVIERANSIVPDPLKNYDGSPKIEDTESVNEGGMKQAQIEVEDWVAKYEKYTGVNGDDLPNGYLQAKLNSGIMSDAYDQDEYMAFNEKNGYESDMEWQEGDMEKFMASSPITRGMFDEIETIMGKYGIDDEQVNSIMGYFDEGKTKTINSEEKEMENNQKDTVEVAVEDLARILDLAGIGKEVKKADEQAQAEATSEVELDEYSNSPDEDYFDTDTQLNKMSGGLNGPKKMYKKEYPGDNPLAVDLEQKLAKMLSDM